MSPDDLIASLEEQIIQQKAELTYWKETAEHYKNEAKELEKHKYQTAISEELKNTIEKVTKHLTNRNTKCYT